MITRPSFARALLGLLSSVLPLAIGATATAQTSDPVAVVVPEPASVVRLPVMLTERPLTLPRYVFTGSADLAYLREDATQRYANLTLSTAVGIMDDLTLRAVVAPFQLTGPGDVFRYGQTDGTRGPSLGAAYRFLKGGVELGVGLDLRVFTTQNISGGAIIPSIPVAFHLTRGLRLGVVPQLNLTRASQTESGTAFSPTPTSAIGDNSTRLDIPVTLVWNPLDVLFLEVGSGVDVEHLFNNASQTTGIPLVLAAGFTIPGRPGPLLDVAPYVDFPFLWTTGAATKTETGNYTIGVTIVGYSYP